MCVCARVCVCVCVCERLRPRGEEVAHGDVADVRAEGPRGQAVAVVGRQDEAVREQEPARTHARVRARV